jgi:hypothetical protein
MNGRQTKDSGTPVLDLLFEILLFMSGVYAARKFGKNDTQKFAIRTPQR